MITIPSNKKNSFDDKLLAEGQTYTVGINDGVHFKKVIFKGTKLFNGKEMMVFSTDKFMAEIGKRLTQIADDFIDDMCDDVCIVSRRLIDETNNDKC